MPSALKIAPTVRRSGANISPAARGVTTPAGLSFVELAAPNLRNPAQSENGSVRALRDRFEHCRSFPVNATLPVTASCPVHPIVARDTKPRPGRPSACRHRLVGALRPGRPQAAKQAANAISVALMAESNSDRAISRHDALASRMLNVVADAGHRSSSLPYRTRGLSLCKCASVLALAALRVSRAVPMPGLLHEEISQWLVRATAFPMFLTLIHA